MSNPDRRARGPAAQSHPSVHPSEQGGLNHRHPRLEHALTRELCSLIHDEAADPALSRLRVIAVVLSPDGGHARVAYAIRAGPGLPEGPASRVAAAALERASPFLRARLAFQLDLKRVPRLSFTFVGIDSEGEP